MLHQNWIKILVVSFTFVLLCNAFLSSFFRAYYKKIPVGRLSHSQLRVKQGNANPEQRFNVFVVSLLFGILNLRVLLVSLLCAVIANFVFLSFL